jgi:hypothetical protein
MHYKTLAIAFALSTAGLAQKVEVDDVPRQCLDICTPVITLTANCDDRGPSKFQSLTSHSSLKRTAMLTILLIKDDDDLAERQCICNAQNASTQIPNCAACISQNGGKFDNGMPPQSPFYIPLQQTTTNTTSFKTDAEELVRDCNFAPATNAPGGAPSPSGTRPGAGPSANPMPSNTPGTNTPGGTNNNPPADNTNTSPSATTSNTTPNNNNAGGGAQGNAQPVGNAANSPTVAMAAVAAAGLAGFVGLFL